MSRTVLNITSIHLANVGLIAISMAACGGSTRIDDAYNGGPLRTNDIANPTVDVPPLHMAGFHDSFSGPDGQPIAGRQPEDAAFSGSVWITPATTNWRINSEAAVLATIAERGFRAVIDVGRPRNWLRVRVVREEGMAGLVTRYRDEQNWVMVWSYGESMVAGQQVDGEFTELGRQAFDWPSSSSQRYFDLIDTGTTIVAFVGGQEILRFTFEPDFEARGVGLFSRGTNKNRFDNFTVWAASADALGAAGTDAQNGSSTGDDLERPTPITTVVPESGDTPATGGPATGTDAPPPNSGPTIPAADPDTLARGSALLGNLGCGSCHTVEGHADATGEIGPVLDGVGDRAHTRIPGTSADVYLRDSITDPGSFIVPGFPGVMPSFEDSLSPDDLDDLDALVAYLLSLSTGDIDEITGISDSFNGGRQIDKGRSPELGPAGSIWTAEAGGWRVGSSGIQEETGAQADHRLIVDSGIERASVSADVSWSGGFAGIVTRYTDSKNWIMVWYDPAGLFLVAYHSDAGFKEVERAGFAWGEHGTTHNIRLDDYGDIVDLWVDDEFFYSFGAAPVPDSTSGGVFSRGGGENEFANFSASEAGIRPEELGAEPEPAPGVPQPPKVVPPQVVLPPDPALAPQYVEEWRERRKEPHLSGSLAGNGYTLESVVDEGIAHPISLTFGDNGVLYLASGELADLEKGAIYALRQLPNGDFEPPVLMAVGFRRAIGILYAYDSLYVSSRGVITRLRDTDGDLVADETEELITGLPFGIFGVKGQATEHQTQSMRVGPDGRIYVIQGATTDRSPVTQKYEGTIFSMLEDGSDVQEYAYGFRNPFDIDFNANGDMFTADNSANVKPDENPPDELHYVRPRGDHGFPDVLGDPPEGSDVEKPLKTWLPSLAPGGLEFYDGGTLTALSENDMLLAKWNFLEIARVRIELVDGVYQYIEDENIVQGFGTPVTDVTVAPNGDIYIADWDGGRIFRISP